MNDHGGQDPERHGGRVQPRGATPDLVESGPGARVTAGESMGQDAAVAALEAEVARLRRALARATGEPEAATRDPTDSGGPDGGGPDGSGLDGGGAEEPIFDLRAAKAALNASRTAFAESEERYRAVVESATEHAIVTLDLRGGVTGWSPGAEAIFGWAAAEVLGRSGDLIWTPEDRAAAMPERGRRGALRDGHALDERWHLRRDGTRFWASGYLTPLRRGGTQGFLQILRDRTPERRVEEALREREARGAFLLRLSDALRPLDDPEAIQDAAMRVLREELGAARAHYTVAEGDRSVVIRRDDVREGVASLAGRYHLSDFPVVAAAMRGGRALVVADVAEAWELAEADRAGCIALGVVAFVAVPIAADGDHVATLAVTEGRPRAWTQEEVALVEETAARTRAAFARARAEAALRDSEARLQLAIEATGMDTFVWHVGDGRTTAEPPMSAPSLGRRPGGASLREALRGVIHPDDRPLHDARVARMLDPSGDGLLREEIRVTLHDGTLRWLSVAARAIFEGSPRRAVRAAGTVMDITAAKEAEAALRESEGRFRGFAENSADTLWIADRHGTRLEYLSPSFEEMFGEPRDRVVADLGRWAELIHPDDREGAMTGMPRLVAGETVTAQYRVIRPSDGKTVLLRDTGFPIRDASGAVARVAGITRDVTGVQRAMDAVRESEGRFRTLVEGVPQLIWRSRDEGQWTWASPQWLDYTGQHQEGSHGLGWLEAVHPEDRERTMAAWQAARSHGRLDVDYRVRRAADGTWRWHQTRSLPMRGAPEPGAPDGPILEWLGATTDIHDLKQMQGQQAVLLAELQHRTRNLLAVVQAIAIRSLSAGTERDNFSDRLVSMGRVQGFLARSAEWSVPLRDLVEAELNATGAGPSARVAMSGPDVSLPGDKVQPVALALHELATNSVKYGALHVPSGHLAVTWGLDGDRLTLDWRESGVTLPPSRPRRGYGSELIERALPYQLGAETRLEWGGDGVSCRIGLSLRS